MIISHCFYFFFFFISDSFSLELTKISIPTYRIFNDPALLECHYQLNTSKNNRHEYAYRSSSSYSNRNHNNDDRLPYGRYDNDDIEKKDEKLYSVKWYKDNEEFYTYVPRANPPQRTHHVEGVKVDVSNEPATRSFYLILKGEKRVEKMRKEGKQMKGIQLRR